MGFSAWAVRDGDVSNFCKGLADFDQDVDADDVTEFLKHFGRSPFFNPCPFDGPAPVGRTGQTTSYYEGDDGGRQKGVEWPVPRFLDEGDGTIFDRLTGLRWLKNANCFGPRLWEQAITDCNVLADGQCGLADGSSGGQWRLPNHKELFSLVDAKNYNPALPSGHPFTNVLSGVYWSSTTGGGDTAGAWVVYFHNGAVIGDNKSFAYFVWPVRGGH